MDIVNAEQARIAEDSGAVAGIDNIRTARDSWLKKRE
jgi:pyridoxal biosynthesis lyase PdxS